MSSEFETPLYREEYPTGRRYVIFFLAAGTSWFLYLHRYTWNFIRPASKRNSDSRIWNSPGCTRSSK